jgi:hypothetical protein
LAFTGARIGKSGESAVIWKLESFPDTAIKKKAGSHKVGRVKTRHCD